MQRRQFLKNSVLLSAAGLVGPAVISQTVRAAEPSVAPVARRRFVLSQTYKLNPPKGSSGVVKLWIPLPVDTAFQQMTALAFSGNYKQAYVTTNNTYGAKTLFATWPDSQGELLINVDIDIETADWEPLKEAAQRIAYAEDRAILDGYSAAGIRGIRPSSSNTVVPVPQDAVDVPEAISSALSQLRLAGVEGPYSVLLGAELYTLVSETSDHGVPILDHLNRLVDGEIIWAPAIRGAVVVTTRGGDFDQIGRAHV